VICVYDAAGNVIETHEHEAAADVQSSAPSVITKGEPPRKPWRAAQSALVNIWRQGF
jgi:hypothetical protein